MGPSGPALPWIAVIGDRIERFVPQDAIESSVGHAAAAAGHPVPAIRWFGTDLIEREGVGILQTASGVWCAPGSPYHSLTGALDGIRAARTQNLPFLGTCAGFQHGVIEVARNMLGHPDAGHAEYGDAASADLFIDELRCSLVGQVMEVDLIDDEIARLYGSHRAVERYYCRFGLTPRWREPLAEAGLITAAVDTADGDVRVMRLTGHPFFVLTLFVPQTSSMPGAPHPLVAAFLKEVMVRSRSNSPC